MRKFSIVSVEKDSDLERDIRNKKYNEVVGLDSMGLLGDIVVQLALIQQTKTPVLKKPVLLVFAADHGIVGDYISHIPTYKLVLSYLNDRAAINDLCRKNNAKLKVVDVGVDHSFEGMLTFWLHHGNKFIDQKIDFGTHNFFLYPAMSTEQCDRAISLGETLVKKEFQNGTNALLLGNLGAGNIMSSIAITMAILDIDEEEFGEMGMDLNLIERAVKKHPKTHDPFTILTLFGGFEIAAMVGAILKAAELRMLVIIDGPASSAALLLAYYINKNVLDYVLTAEIRMDSLDQRIAEHLSIQPLFTFNLKMPEGCGSVMTLPIIKSSIQIFKNLSDPHEETE